MFLHFDGYLKKEQKRAKQQLTITKSKLLTLVYPLDEAGRPHT